MKATKEQIIDGDGQTGLEAVFENNFIEYKYMITN